MKRPTQPPRGPRPEQRAAPNARPAHAPGREKLHLPRTPDPGADRPRVQEGRTEKPRPQEPARNAQGHRPRSPAPPHHGAHHGARDAHTQAATPHGALWLYGIHAVAAALANPARRLRRLVLTEDAEAALAAIIPQPWPIAPERVERARLDQLLGREAVHQGAGLLADPLAPPAMAQALERPGPVIVLDQVTDPRNVGAILRSAAAFGAAAIIVQDRHAPEESGALAKAASGALEQVPLLRAVNIVRTLVALKAAGLWVVGLDAAAPPLAGPTLAQRRVALVLGAEGDGMRRLTRETCDEIAGLAMPGLMDSLNVSAAAAVALYELRRS